MINKTLLHERMLASEREFVTQYIPDQKFGGGVLYSCSVLNTITGNGL